MTLLPSPAGPPVRITSASVAFVPPSRVCRFGLLPSIKPQPVSEPGEAHTNAWTIDLGAPGVPIAELALDISDGAFERRAILAAANHLAYWAPVAATLLYRVPPSTVNRDAVENVRTSPAARFRANATLRLTVYNGDDAPLGLRSVGPRLRRRGELVFRAPVAGVYTLFVGGDVPAPSATI